MKLQDIINESFSNSYPYEPNYTNPNAWGAMFTTADHSVVKVHGENNAVEFYGKHTQGPSLWDISFSRNGDDGVTGDGDAQRIFATVINIIKEYNEKYKPDFITIGASKRTSNRGKLYGRMIARYASAFGYEHIPVPSDDNRVPPEFNRSMRKHMPGLDVFLLIRKQ